MAAYFVLSATKQTWDKRRLVSSPRQDGTTNISITIGHTSQDSISSNLHPKKKIKKIKTNFSFAKADTVRVRMASGRMVAALCALLVDGARPLLSSLLHCSALRQHDIGRHFGLSTAISPNFIGRSFCKSQLLHSDGCTVHYFGLQVLQCADDYYEQNFIVSIEMLFFLS